MLLNLSILEKELENNGYTVSYIKHENTTFYSYRIYTGGPLKEHVLYLVRPEQLAFMNDPESKCALICGGIPIAPSFSLRQGVILLKEPVALETLTNALAEIWDHYNFWEARLNSAEHSYDGMQKMLDRSAAFLSGTLILSDSFFNYILFTKDFLPYYTGIRKNTGGNSPSFAVDEILTNPAYHKIRTLRDPFEFPIHLAEDHVKTAVCVNLFRPDQKDHYARLIFYNSSEEYDGSTRYIVSVLAEKISTIYRELPQRQYNNEIYHSLREMIRSCIGSSPAGEEFAEIVVRNAGWQMNDQFVLIKFMSYFSESRREFNELALNEVESIYPRSCAVTYGEELLLLVNMTKSQMTENSIFNVKFVSFLRERLYKAGVSNMFGHFTDIRSAYEEAGAAIRIGNVKNGMFWYHTFSDYTLDYMLECAGAKVNRSSLCCRELKILIACDKENQTEYYKALREYLRYDRNTTHAANALFIHRTTLLKYLEKIDALTGLDLDDWDTRLNLMLSYRMLENG